MNTWVLLGAEEERCTFTYVIVDVVSRGTGDQSLTDVTPSGVHAELLQLAGVHVQTLVYIWMFKKQRRRRQMCE